MRTNCMAWIFLGLSGVSVGCYDLLSDENIFRQAGVDHLVNAGGAGGTGGTGGTTTVPPGCVPSNTSDPVDDGCGVFVSLSLGSDENDGVSKEKAFATIGKALGAATGKPIYLCGETFVGAVEIGGGALIYGGLDCGAGWKYDASKPTVITAEGDEIPLRVRANKSVEMLDVVVRAADAKLSGGSSVGVIAEAEANVTLTRCSVEAGNGANGADGLAFVDTATAGLVGTDGGEACSASQVITPIAPVSECGEVDSIAGDGGIGGPNSGGAGSPGLPDGTMNGGQGEGGAVCTDGTVGDDGAVGAPGDGAKELGGLQADAGFVGAAGKEGKAGGTAQGGGGGGGAKGGTGGVKCATAMSAGGGSGGSGGSGGCGGLGGKGGQAGGASIAIVSLGATLVFSDVSLSAKMGGKGGNGGVGQAGGVGGVGGKAGLQGAATDLNDGCKGGDGGKGGSGGKGGGGRGGHSIGIAHSGAAPNMNGATITTGTAGNGGTGEGTTGNGDAGVVAEVQAF